MNLERQKDVEMNILTSSGHQSSKTVDNNIAKLQGHPNDPLINDRQINATRLGTNTHCKLWKIVVAAAIMIFVAGIVVAVGISVIKHNVNVVAVQSMKSETTGTELDLLTTNTKQDATRNHIEINEPITSNTAKVITSSTSNPVKKVQSTDNHMCTNLPVVNYSTTNCSQSVPENTDCQYTCMNNRTIKGHGTMRCSSNGNWLGTPPTCECPSDCQCRDNCSLHNSWQESMNAITSSSSQSNYAGHQISCKSEFQLKLKKSLPVLRFRCTCEDLHLTQRTTCKNFKSSGGACKHALVKLIQQYALDGKYPSPCDTNTIQDYLKLIYEDALCFLN